MSGNHKRKTKNSPSKQKQGSSTPSPGTSTRSEEVIQVDNNENESSSTKSISIQASISRASSYNDLEETNDESYLKRMHNTDMEDPDHSLWDPNYSTFSTPSNTSKNRTSTPTMRSRKSDLSWSERDEQREYWNYLGNEEKSGFARELLRALHDKDVREMLEGTICGPILKKLQVVETNLNNANTKIQDLEKANQSLNERLTKIENEIKSDKDKNKGKDIAPLQSQIITMKHTTNIAKRMNDQDRKNNVVIHGIDEAKGESPKQLTSKIKEILKNAAIKLDDKFEATRLGKPNAEAKRPVKVCLNNYWDKRVLYKARTTMKSTGNMGIFINEDLPKIQQTLLMHCRKARRNNQLETCWTEEGIVHIKTENKEDEIIPNLEKLTEVTGYTVSTE